MTDMIAASMARIKSLQAELERSKQAQFRQATDKASSSQPREYIEGVYQDSEDEEEEMRRQWEEQERMWAEQEAVERTETIEPVEAVQAAEQESKTTQAEQQQQHTKRTSAEEKKETSITSATPASVAANTDTTGGDSLKTSTIITASTANNSTCLAVSPSPNQSAALNSSTLARQSSTAVSTDTYNKTLANNSNNLSTHNANNSTQTVSPRPNASTSPSLAPIDESSTNSKTSQLENHRPAALQINNIQHSLASGSPQSPDPITPMTESALQTLHQRTDSFRLYPPFSGVQQWSNEDVKVWLEQLELKLCKQGQVFRKKGWSAEETQQWLKELHSCFQRYILTFVEKCVDGAQLVQLSEGILKNELGVTSHYHRLAMLSNIKNRMRK